MPATTRGAPRPDGQLRARVQGWPPHTKRVPNMRRLNAHSVHPLTLLPVRKRAGGMGSTKATALRSLGCLGLLRLLGPMGWLAGGAVPGMSDVRSWQHPQFSSTPSNAQIPKAKLRRLQNSPGLWPKGVLDLE